MSFILDALKKSEAERQRQSGPALLEARIARPSRRPPLWAITIGVLLLINCGVVAWLLSRSGAPTQATPVPAAVAPGALAPGALAPAPFSAAPGAGTLPAGAPPAPAAPGARVPHSSPLADSTEAVNPADLEPAVAPAAGTAPEAATAGVRSYAELAGTLPPLRLDLHVYAANPAERYAFINMHKVHEGDVTPEGVRVTQITREGVVLDYRGTEFLLGRE